MKINTRTKVLSQNCYFTIDNYLQNTLQLAQEEASKVFKDNDCKVIYTYLLIKDVFKHLSIKSGLSQIKLQNDHAKQLYKEIKENIKCKTQKN